MAENSKIAWCDDTVSFWWGCTKIAPGCKDCYALEIALRFAGDLWGPTKPRLVIESAAKKLLALNRKAKKAGVPRVVFINSMSDFFEEFDGPIVNRKGLQLHQCDNCMNPDGTYHRDALKPSKPGHYYEHCCGEHFRPATLNDLRREAFAVMDQCDWLRLMLLTKRPENIRRMWPRVGFPDAGVPGTLGRHLYLANVRLGTSVSNQPTADKMLPELVKCRDLCPVLFVSAEPLLGDLSFRWAQWQPFATEPGGKTDHLDGLRSIDQIIIGNESCGPRCGSLGEFKSEAEWIAAAESIVSQCREAGVAAFVKQIPRDGMTEHDVERFPASLQFREFPTPSGKPPAASLHVEGE